MKIGLDLRLYGTKHGGIGRYIKELSSQLLKIDKKNQYVFFIYQKNDAKKITKNKKTKFVYTPIKWYSLKEQLLLSPLIKKQKLDLMHFPHFNVPLNYNKPFIVTIHDLIVHHFPNERATTLPKWLYQLKLKGYKQIIKNAIKKARTIIVPSNFVKQDILKFYNINADKIKVAYEGISNLNYTLKTKKSTAQQKKKIKIKKYLLYVGSAYPHKNLENLIKAFTLLRYKYKLTDLKLVLVGKIDYFYNQLQKYITAHYSSVTNNCIFYGQADDKELAQLYKNASAFIFPSLHEGFGLPPLEAMSFKTPVVAAKNASISEVCEQAAFYFDPNDPQNIAEKINQLLNDQKLRQNLITAGQKQIKKYSWKQCAKKHLEVYNATLL